MSETQDGPEDPELGQLCAGYALAKAFTANGLHASLHWIVGDPPLLHIDGTPPDLNVCISDPDTFDVWAGLYPEREVVLSGLSAERLWQFIIAVRAKFARVTEAWNDEAAAGHA
jgi:hypothetical protein